MTNDVERVGIADLMAREYAMTSGDFWAVMRRTVVPDDATNEEVAGFLMVAKEYGLNPLLKQLHLFKSKKSGRMLATVGIDGWSAIVNRHPDFDGVEFSFEWADDKPFACTATMHHKQRKHPVVVTEYLSECWRDTDAWKLTPARMLRHRAYGQAARLSFGISMGLDEDNPDLEPIDITPKSPEKAVDAPKPKSAPKAPAATRKRATEAPTMTDEPKGAPTIDGEAHRVTEPAEKDQGSGTPAEQGEPTIDTQAVFREFIDRLGDTGSEDDIDALVEELDVHAVLAHDEDASELVTTAIKKRRRAFA